MDRLFISLGLEAWWLGACLRYGYLGDARLQKRNEMFRRSKPDPFPLPPPEFVFLVNGNFDLEMYYRVGEKLAGAMRALLERNGLQLDGFTRVLDFGCGSGRVMRQWRALRGPELHGCDYNARLVAWCRRALPFAEFRRNRADPPLPYRSDSFDFVYGISIFTHLSPTMQEKWRNELGRIIKRGGHLLLTFHGESFFRELSLEEQRRFQSGEMISRLSRYSGQNFCASFHPPACVRALFRDVFSEIDLSAGCDFEQDAYLFRKL